MTTPDPLRDLVTLVRIGWLATHDGEWLGERPKVGVLAEPMRGLLMAILQAPDADAARAALAAQLAPPLDAAFVERVLENLNQDPRIADAFVREYAALSEPKP